MASQEGAHTSTIHIPKMQWEVIHGWEIYGVSISNTVFTTWLLMGLLTILVLVFNVALKSTRFPRIKNAGLHLIETLDNFTTEFIEDKQFARRFFFLMAGFFLFILVGNIFSLFLDWMGLFAPSLLHYFRPVNSDLNTTLALAASVIVLSQVLSIYYKGPLTYLKNFLFSFHGDNFLEKCINVFVGWLHLIGEFSRLLSLSFRLFGNILAGMVLIGVISFLTGKMSIAGVHLGELLVLPFWFFELFVAFIQALVFLILMNVYFKEAKSTEEH